MVKNIFEKLSIFLGIILMIASNLFKPICFGECSVDINYIIYLRIAFFVGIILFVSGLSSLIIGKIKSKKENKK